MNEQRALRIGIVAGEPSGDLLGAKLIRSLQSLHPNISFVGIGGPQMIAAGCDSIDDIGTLSVNGLIEVLGSIYKIYSLKQKLVRYFTDNPPDAFIGIDAPDFNIPLAKTLKAKGLRTIHFVSPTIWAWRPGRIKAIKQSVDLMLNIFPFEKAIYDAYGMTSEFVGHPLTWEYQHTPKLNTSDLPPLITLMPGSRISEIKKLAPIFLDTAKRCHLERPELTFALPAVNQQIFLTLRELIKTQYPTLPISLSLGQSQNMMQAADVILLASGTATMEGLVYKKPMVVAYQLSPFSFWLGKRMVKVNYAAMPNILAGKMLIPEYLQNNVTPENLATALLKQLDDKPHQTELIKEFDTICKTLYRPPETAAKAILQFLR